MFGKEPTRCDLKKEHTEELANDINEQCKVAVRSTLEEQLPMPDGPEGSEVEDGLAKVKALASPLELNGETGLARLNSAIADALAAGVSTAVLAVYEETAVDAAATDCVTTTFVSED